jgi:hypothetical protein
MNTATEMDFVQKGGVKPNEKGNQPKWIVPTHRPTLPTCAKSQ